MTETYYDATAAPLAPFPPLDGDARADVCVVGGGFTGLGAALALAERGFRVTLIERDRIGSGASGRNGGQFHTGQRRDQIWLEQTLGETRARALWDLALDARSNLDDIVARHRIDCDLASGLVHADHKRRLVPETRAYAEHLRRRYGYDEVEALDREALRAYVRSDDYHGGMLDRGGGHLHPLKLARGMARAAVAASVRIHEATRVTGLDPGRRVAVRTGRGAVAADWAILAGDILLKGLIPEIDRRTLPIASTIAVTEPLGEALARWLPQPVAVADSRFVVNYFRPTPDDRLLFGGGESYSTAPVADPGRPVRKALAKIFPALGGVRFDHAWSGLVGITPNRLPLLRRVHPNVLVAAGYSGQGVLLAPYAGRLMAEAVAGTLERFDLMAGLPVPPFPGGPLLRGPMLIAAMTLFALRDRL